MSTVEAMKAHIARLEEAASGTAEHDESFGMALARRGLAHMKGQLEQDIDVALRPRLDVVIDGAPVQGHEIRIEALSSLLHSLQESVSSVAQALTGDHIKGFTARSTSRQDCSESRRCGPRLVRSHPAWSSQ